MATACLMSAAREEMMQPVCLRKRFPLRSPNLLIFPYPSALSLFSSPLIACLSSSCDDCYKTV